MIFCPIEAFDSYQFDSFNFEYYFYKIVFLKGQNEVSINFI